MIRKYLSRYGRVRMTLKSRRFRRLFLGYVMVLVIPLVVLYLWVVRGVIADKRAAIQAEAVEKMRLLVQSIDQQIDHAQYVALDVGANAALRPVKLMSDVSTVMAGIEELAKYRMNNDFYSDVFYLIEEDSIVYSSLGIMDWDVFIDRKLRASPEDAALLSQDIQAIQNSDIWGREVSQSVGGVILYLLSTRSALNNHHGGIVFSVNMSVLSDMVRTFDPGTYSFYIVNGRDDVLYLRETEMARIPQETFRALMDESAPDGVYSEGQGRQALSVISYHSSRTDWRFFAAAQRNILFQDAVRSQKAVLFLFAAIGVMGGCLVCVLSWRSYLPVAEVKRMVLETMPELDIQLDELDIVREMMDRTIAQRDELESTITQQRREIMRQTLRLLLSGFRSENTGAMLQAMKAARIELSCGAMSVFLVSSVDGVSPFGEEELDALSATFASISYQVYFSPRSDLGAMAALASHPPGEQNRLASLLYREISLVEDDVIVTAGNEVERLTDLSVALNQAGSAMEYARECAEGGVYTYGDISGTGDSIRNLRKAYFQAVLEGDAELALINAHDLIGRVTSSHSYEYGCVVLRELIASLMSFGRPAGDVSENAELSETLRFASFDELRQRLIRLTRDTARYVSARSEETDSRRGGEIRKFIDASFRDPGFSLQLVADHFGMTPNYAGRVFREETGMNFSDYVSEMRFQYVKKALVETDDPIKDIVRAAGYQDVPNFMRKFKQNAGMTPGEYRKLNRKEPRTP